jgi:hypothetical protein
MKEKNQNQVAEPERGIPIHNQIFIGKTDGAFVDVNGFYIGPATKHEVVKRYNAFGELIDQLRDCADKIHEYGDEATAYAVRQTIEEATR